MFGAYILGRSWVCPATIGARNHRHGYVCGLQQLGWLSLSTLPLFIVRAILLVLAFVSWIVFVAPMNTEFAKWLTYPIPADWTRYRDQWEYAHAVSAVIKIMGLSSIVISVLVEIPKTRF